MKKYALVLCAVLLAFGVSVAASAQSAQAPKAGTQEALGNASSVDESTLAIGSEAGTGTAGGNVSTGPNTFLYFVRMVLVLAAVLGAIYLIFRFVKKAGRPKAGSDSAIKVLATTSIGTGKALHVVNLGSKAYLIGSTENSVSLIAEVTEKDVVNDLVLKAETEKASPKMKDFGEVLNSLLPKRKPGAGLNRREREAAAKDQDGLSPEFLELQRERLKKL